MSFPAIQKTLILINEVEDKMFLRDLRQRLKVLLRSVQDAIIEIETYLQTSDYNCYKNKIKLCISQMLKVMPALINLLSEGKHSAFEDIASYMIEKLKWCLMEPMRMFNGGGVEDDTEASGIFVRTIDWAISALQAGEPISDIYKLAIDDLLCQALTIAKLATGQDYNEISSGCRSVLLSLSSAVDRKEMSEATRRLHRDILLCNLETLYRRVNTAVLRLFLYVMSDSFLPLKNIVIKCVENCNDSSEQIKRRTSDLDYLISNLDLYLEQIHLLGNFGVACTDSNDVKIRVQCCLASLEFCETHLVPAITSFYMDQRKNRRDYLSFLTDEAQKSLKDLHLLMDNIVDTGSFARVVFEDLTDLIQNIRENISDGIFEKRETEVFQRRCKTLAQHLSGTDDKYVRQDPTVTQTVKQLMAVVLKNQNDNLQTRSPAVNHMIWDLDIALDLLDRLCQKLNFSAMNHTSEGRISIDRSVSFPDSVRNLPMDISTPRSDKSLSVASREGQLWLRSKFINSYNKDGDSHVGESGDNLSFALEPYLNRVGETPMIKSTLYCRTPLKTPKILRKDHTAYDFADILDEICNFPNDTWVPYKEVISLDKNEGAVLKKQEQSLATALSINPTIGNEDINVFNNTICRPRNLCDSDSVLTSDISKFDATERLRDLMYLEEKISTLSMKHFNEI